MAKKKIILTFSTIKFYLFCAIFSTIIPNILVYYSARYINSAILTILANVSPILTYTLAVMCRQESFNYKRFILILGGIIGIMLVLGSNKHNIFLNWQMLHSYWFYLMLLVPISYAITVIYIDKFNIKNVNYTSKALGMLFIASICLLPLAIKDGLYIPHLNQFNTQLLLLEIALSTFDSLLIFFIINGTGAVYYTMVNAATTLVGVIYGYLIYHQVYDKIIYCAIALIVISIIGINLTQKKHKQHVK